MQHVRIGIGGSAKLFIAAFFCVGIINDIMGCTGNGFPTQFCAARSGFCSQPGQHTRQDLIFHGFGAGIFADKRNLDLICSNSLAALRIRQHVIDIALQHLPLLVGNSHLRGMTLFVIHITLCRKSDRFHPGNAAFLTQAANGAGLYYFAGFMIFRFSNFTLIGVRRFRHYALRNQNLTANAANRTFRQSGRDTRRCNRRKHLRHVHMAGRFRGFM